MGKGFNNYMCKKFFHPASRDNLKRVWMAQQKDEAYKKKQEELRVQYEKEQDLYNNKAMLSKESKDKLSVNFMYEPPPGAKKEREKEENEPEYKFEWQRKYNAPREDYCKGNAEIQDQPFGILVRNVRCIKCRKWGHINTDKECPLYNQSVTSEIANEASDALSLLRGMREDGLRMRKTALDAQQHVEIPRYKALVQEKEAEDENIDENELKFLKGLSTKEKLKLLKKLEKLESNGVKHQSSESESEENESENHKKKKNKLKKKKKKENDSKKEAKGSKRPKKYNDSEESEGSDSEEEEKSKKKKHTKDRKKEDKKKVKDNHVKKYKKQKTSSDSESSDEEDERKSRKRKKVRQRKEEMSDEGSNNAEESRREKKNYKSEGRRHEREIHHERHEKRRERKTESRQRSRSRSRSPTRKHSSLHR